MGIFKESKSRRVKRTNPASGPFKIKSRMTQKCLGPNGKEYECDDSRVTWILTPSSGGHNLSTDSTIFYPALGIGVFIEGEIFHFLLFA